MLEVENIEVGYGAKRVLSGVSLTVRSKEVVSLMGRNGMGKTTTARAIMGLLRPTKGSIQFAGVEQSGRAVYKVARAGLALVPEGRQIFPTLTVRENLVATARRDAATTDVWTLDRVHALFPRLKERDANLGFQLSGGEQQMLAIGRALMTNPKLLILDEATEGLSPIARDEIWACLKMLKQSGLSLLIIDKNLRSLMQFADRHFILEKGSVVWTGTSQDLRQSTSVIQRYLGV